MVKAQQAPQLPWFLILLALDLQLGGAPTLKLDWTLGISDVGVPSPRGFLAPRSPKKDKFRITLVLLIKKISKLVDRVCRGSGQSIEVLDILEGPAELGELGLIGFRSEILSFGKINSVLIVALSGASVVSRGKGQECDKGNGEDTSVHKL